jgi:hypothetical protein
MPGAGVILRSPFFGGRRIPAVALNGHPLNVSSELMTLTISS